MSLAIITLSRQGAHQAVRVAAGFPNARLYLHEKVEGAWRGERFASIAELTGRIFRGYAGLLYIAPCGVVVRAITPHLRGKKHDPAVVVADVFCRWAVSLLGGHEAGANDLAMAVANLLGAEPVITTTTEALKSLIVGIGCRKGTEAHRIVAAVYNALDETGGDISQVRLLASADIKASEEGLKAAARELGLPLRFVASVEIRDCGRSFGTSEFVASKVRLPAVAEPCALLAGRRARLILTKRNYSGVSVAVAEESSMW